jgi:hypothetical protein
LTDESLLKKSAVFICDSCEKHLQRERSKYEKQFLTRKSSGGHQAKRRKEEKNQSPRNRKACHGKQIRKRKCRAGRGKKNSINTATDN